MATLTWWRGLGSAAIDLLYPLHCPGCGSLEGRGTGERAPGPLLCKHCELKVWPCEDPRCQTCGEGFLPAGTGGFVCQNCMGREFAFDYAVAPYESRGILRDLIHRFKYQGQLFLRPLFGQFLVGAWEDPRLGALESGWVAVPVPLHPRRYREREFNQALELCRELRARRGVPICDCLRRTRYTVSQTSYRRDQRMANLHGAFVVKRRKAGRLADRTVVLVDDVFTTGSTANECATALKDAGAKKVVVITLARG